MCWEKFKNLFGKKPTTSGYVTTVSGTGFENKGIVYELKFNQSKIVPLWLLIGLEELGQEEIPGSGSNSRIDEYLKTVGQPGDDSIPWCAAFVNWTLFKAGMSYPGKPDARSLLGYGKKIDKFRLGCIAVFERGSEGWQGHTGYPLDISGGYVKLLGGNQMNRVTVEIYSLSKLLGYVWPTIDIYGNPYNF